MPDCVSIKGTKNGLVVLLNSNGDFNEIKSGLREKMEAARGFFKGAKFSLSGNIQELSYHEKLELERLCCGYGLECCSVETIATRKPNTASPPKKLLSVTGLLPQEKDLQTLLFSKTLRAGQKIVHEGNVVIWSDVNPGAEILATHNIIVLGNCRGNLHAGAAGNEKATIFAFNLQPIQLRISNHFTCFEEEQATRGPHLAYLAKGKIVREKYSTDLLSFM